MSKRTLGVGAVVVALFVMGVWSGIGSARWLGPDSGAIALTAALAPGKEVPKPTGREGRRRRHLRGGADEKGSGRHARLAPHLPRADRQGHRGPHPHGEGRKSRADRSRVVRPLSFRAARHREAQRTHRHGSADRARLCQRAHAEERSRRDKGTGPEGRNGRRPADDHRHHHDDEHVRTAPLSVTRSVSAAGRFRRPAERLPPHERSSAPKRSASAATMRSRSVVASSSVSVRSGDWNARWIATDLRPAPTWSPR